MIRPGTQANPNIERAPSSTSVFARLRPGQQWVWSNHQVGHLLAKLPRRVTIKAVQLGSYAVIVSESKVPLHPNLFVDGTYSIVPGIDDKLTGNYTTYYRQMFAVPIQQPWAWALLAGHCSLINKQQPPGDVLRKRVWIYADELDSRTWLEMKRQGIYGLPNEMEFPTGVLLGSGVIEKSVSQIKSQWFRGPQAWIFSGVVPIPEPIKTEKKDGLWVPELYR